MQCSEHTACEPFPGTPVGPGAGTVAFDDGTGKPDDGDVDTLELVVDTVEDSELVVGTVEDSELGVTEGVSEAEVTVALCVGCVPLPLGEWDTRRSGAVASMTWEPTRGTAGDRRVGTPVPLPDCDRAIDGSNTGDS